MERLGRLRNGVRQQFFHQEKIVGGKLAQLMLGGMNTEDDGGIVLGTFQAAGNPRNQGRRLMKGDGFQPFS